MFSKISSLYYHKSLLFFVAPSQDGEVETALYFKSLPADGSSSKFVNFITDRFNAIVSVGTIDNFIYVADSAEGFFAIEPTLDGSYGDPVAIPVAF